MNREELYNNFIQTHNELSHDEVITMIDFIEIVKKIPATMLQRVAESIISIKKSEIQILTITQNVGKTKKKITLQINEEYKYIKLYKYYYKELKEKIM